jgi:hypothetical protein
VSDIIIHAGLLPLPDALGFPHDHATISWEHWLAQHIGKSNTENFVRSFYQPLNLLDKALNDLYTQRFLATAQGKQLDGIGSIVGISRGLSNQIYLSFFGFRTQISGRGFGQARFRKRYEPWASTLVLGDTEYRVVLFLKISLNNGYGTAEQLMYAFNTSLQVTRTRVEDVGNANARVYINDFIMSTDPRSQLLEFMIPRAAGVKLWVYFWDVDFTFGFSNQNMGYYGFNIGILARSVGSNIPPITESFSTWDNGESIWDAGYSIWDTLGNMPKPDETVWDFLGTTWDSPNTLWDKDEGAP